MDNLRRTIPELAARMGEIPNNVEGRSSYEIYLKSKIESLGGEPLAQITQTEIDAIRAKHSVMSEINQTLPSLIEDDSPLGFRTHRLADKGLRVFLESYSARTGVFEHLILSEDVLARNAPTQEDRESITEMLPSLRIFLFVVGKVKEFNVIDDCKMHFRSVRNWKLKFTEIVDAGVENMDTTDPTSCVNIFCANCVKFSADPLNNLSLAELVSHIETIVNCGANLNEFAAVISYPIGLKLATTYIPTIGTSLFHHLRNSNSNTLTFLTEVRNSLRQSAEAEAARKAKTHTNKTFSTFVNKSMTFVLENKRRVTIGGSLFAITVTGAKYSDPMLLAVRSAVLERIKTSVAIVVRESIRETSRWLVEQYLKLVSDYQRIMSNRS